MLHNSVEVAVIGLGLFELAVGVLAVKGFRQARVGQRAAMVRAPGQPLEPVALPPAGG